MFVSSLNGRRPARCICQDLCDRLIFGPITYLYGIFLRFSVPHSAPSNTFYLSLRLEAMSMITATTWVPRGFAAPFPTKYVFDEEEFERISTLAKLQLDDAKEDLQEARKGNHGGSKKEGLNGSQNGGQDVLESHE